MTAILQISDGTTTIDLIKGQNEYGFHLSSWRPQITGYKGGGTWQQSALSAGRQLVDKQFENYIDTFSLKANQYNQDTLIWELQEIRRLLEKASSYWTTDWQDEPVYLIAKATDETNTRYSLIHTGRIPEDEQPYAQPFLQPLCASVMDNLTLVIEHGFWLGNIPGTGTCVEISAEQSAPDSYYLLFNGDTSNVEIPGEAQITNLPSGVNGFTCDGWIKADGYGGGGDGQIFFKSNAASSVAWNLYVSSTSGLRAQVIGAIGGGNASSGLDEFTADGAWHHVLCTYIDNVPNLIYLAIDGTWVASYSSQTAVQGGPSPEGADNEAYIGSAISTNGFDGDIGWMRLSNTVRYTVGVNFEPPVQCTPPDSDVNTMGQWIGAEGSGSTIDNQEGTAALDGTQSNCTFGTACTYGRTETCEDEVYIANKHNQAQITHIFVDDGGVFGANLQGSSLPYNLLPAVPAVNDAVYFGIDTSIPNSGPFCSLVFDIGTAITDVTDIVWEYWNGAWVALTPQDNTDTDGAMTGVAFDTTGVNSVHWAQPSAWATTAVNGITGYWVRARVNTIGAAPTSPTQQNRQVYSVVWPYLEVDNTQVSGDIDPLLRILVYSQSLRPGPSYFPEMVTLGLRSLARGANFTAYINISDEQNPSGITVAAGPSSSFANNINAPSGRALLYNPGGAQAIGKRATITFSSSITQEYYGSYKIYVRASGVTADFAMYLQTSFGTTYTTETILIDSAGPWAVYDFGKIRLFPNQPMADILTTATIDIYIAKLAAGTETLSVYDLILIPVDELAGQYVAEGTASTLVNGRVLDIDGIEYPKKQRAILRLDSDLTSVVASWRIRQPGDLILHSNASQRLWFFIVDVVGAYEVAPMWWAWSVQLFKNQRYLSSRGAR